MEEVLKHRLLRFWLAVLYVTLWTLGLAVVVLAAGWLFGLYRYAIFVLLGLAVGGYLSSGTETMVERVTRAILVLAAAGFAVYVAVAAAASRILLSFFGLAAIAFFGSAGLLALTVRFVRRMAERVREPQEAEPGELLGTPLPASAAAVEAQAPEQTVTVPAVESR